MAPPAYRVETGQNVCSAIGLVFSLITSDGETWWQDTANNRVWVKLRGGRWQFWTTDPNEAVPTGDDLLYDGMVLRVRVP